MKIQKKHTSSFKHHKFHEILNVYSQHVCLNVKF